MTKVEITGASAFIRRMYEACGPYQWAREFLMNSLESGATRVEFGIEWNSVELFSVYKRVVIDNGSGMSRDELLRFFSTLGAGGKKIGGVHDNYGVGAKIAALPWNPEGLTVVSYKNGKASMICIRLDVDSGDYELHEWTDSKNRKQVVIDPHDYDWEDVIPYDKLKPAWLGDNGTIIVLEGKSFDDDTIAPEGEAVVGGLARYLNSRFWDLSNVDVFVAEMRSEQKHMWAKKRTDADDQRRPNNRQIRGAKYYLDTVKVKDDAGRLSASGVLPLDNGRVEAHWYLWEGLRPALRSYANQTGYVAVKYKNELYDLHKEKARYRWFGVIDKKVQEQLTIVLVPKLYDATNGKWGIHCDQSRNRLMFTGGTDKGTELPMTDWAEEFAMNMPDPILAAIKANRQDDFGSIEDEEYRKRLKDRFGDRWSKTVLVPRRKGFKGKSQGTLSPAMQNMKGHIELDLDPSTRTHPNPRPQPRPKHRTPAGTPIQTMLPKGTGKAEEMQVPVDIPVWRPGEASAFAQEFHLAIYMPNDPQGPTVYLNIESSLIRELVESYQAKYPPHFAEDVAREVTHTLGEVAVAKVAHAQILAAQVPEHILNEKYRSEEALTVALMGLIAEESLISQRLGKLGRKTKSVA